MRGRTVDSYTLRVDLLDLRPQPPGGFASRVTLAAYAVPEPAAGQALAPLALSLVGWRRRGRG